MDERYQNRDKYCAEYVDQDVEDFGAAQFDQERSFRGQQIEKAVHGL